MASLPPIPPPPQPEKRTKNTYPHAFGSGRIYVPETSVGVSLKRLGLGESTM